MMINEVREHVPDDQKHKFDDYLNIADELSDPDMTIKDLSLVFVTSARKFASEHGLPFPPVNGIDIANDRCAEAFVPPHLRC